MSEDITTLSISAINQVKGFLENANDNDMRCFLQTHPFECEADLNNFLIAVLMVGKTTEELAEFFETSTAAIKVIANSQLKPFANNQTMQ